MDNCTICLESLSIPLYVAGTTEVNIENDCSRIACGHAFHTKCLIQSLNITPGCPLCRIVEETHYNVDPELYTRQHIHMQLYCSKILDEVKNDILVEHLKDYKSFVRELEEKRKVFNKRVTDFKEKLREEMNITPILSHIDKVKKDTKRIFRHEIKKRGGIFATSLRIYGTCTYQEKYLFGERNPWNFSFKNKRDFW